MSNDPFAFTGGPKPLVMRFDSWGALLERAERGPATTSHERISRDPTDGRYYFTGGSGTLGWEPALDQARNGWPAGEERVAALSAQLERAVLPAIVREDWNFDVEGAAFDVARYVEGEPEHWIKLEDSQLEAPHRHVRIVYNCAVSAGIGPDVIAARGAATAALVNLLEYAGHRVEVVVSDARGMHSNTPLTTKLIRVKAYDQPLEPSRLAFAMVSPAMLRRILFAIDETMPEAYVSRVGCIEAAYGTPCDVLPAERGEDCLYIGRALYGDVQWTEPAAALAWCVDTLKAQGIEVNMTAIEHGVQSRPGRPIGQNRHARF